MSSYMSSTSLEPQIKNPMRKIQGSRSSEISNPMRRSFNGSPFGKPSGVAVPRGFNPVTPANSPSAFPRSSIDKSSKPIDRGFEEKENGMDRISKQSRVESPGQAKPTKHFMSPTISAVSKINASPRKKILAEKNELTRSSGGSLNVCEEDGAARSEVEASESQEQSITDPSSSRSRISSAKKVAFDSDVQVIPLSDPEILSAQEEAEQPDCVDSHEVDAENKAERSSHLKSPRSPSAPLDADPLMTPYDPDTNYLSPRPQFLHYRPTPRINRFLGEETYGPYLNDSIDFVEGLSEAELTEDTSSDDSSREPQNEVLGDIDKELKNDVDVIFTAEDEEIDVVGSIPIEKEEADARDVVPAKMSELTFFVGDDSEVTNTVELEAIEEVPMVENGKESATEEKLAAKEMRFLTKFKFCVLVLGVLVVGMLKGGVHSPIASSVVGISKEWRLHNIVQEAEIGEFVKMKADVVARNFGWLYEDLLDYIFGVIHKPRVENELCIMNYYNSSSMKEDSVFRKDTGSSLLLNDRNHELKVVGNRLEQFPRTATLEEDDESPNEEDNDFFKDAGGEAEERGVEANEMLFWDEETKQEESDLDAIEIEFLEKFEVHMISESIEELLKLQENIEGRSEMEPANEWTKDEELPRIQENVEGRSEMEPAIEWTKDEELPRIQENVEGRSEMEPANEWTKDEELPRIQENVEGRSEMEPANEWTKDEELPLIQDNVEGRSEMEPANEWTKDDKPATAQSRLEYLQPASEFQVDNLEVEKDVEPDYARDEHSAFIAVGGICALVLTLVTFGGLLYFKPKREAVMSRSTSKEQLPLKLNKFDISPTSAANIEEHDDIQLWLKKHASSSCPTVVDFTGESYPLEMSSFQKNSFPRTESEPGGEVQSRKSRNNNPRRESLASSSDFSTGSPSYGSFTTYEKIPVKNRNRKEEAVITPIRRSSRLLKKVASP